MTQNADLAAGIARVAAAPDPAGLLHVALELAVNTVGARLGYAALGHPAAPSWWTASVASGEVLEVVRQRVSSSIVAAALAEGRCIVTTSAVDDARFSDRASVRRNALQAVICAPLGGTTAPGVLYLEGRAEGGRFTDEEVRLVEHLARVIAALARRFLVELGPPDADPTAEWRARLSAAPIIGRSRPLAAVLEQIVVAAPRRLPVLLVGPTGTGKSALARVLHDSGPRAKHPFAIVDCTLLHAERAEADLFGALPGAYTGLNRTREGAIAAARSGTLFLDEIGALAPDVQNQLLLFLQDATYRPMGGDVRDRRADVRIVAATSRDPGELLEPLYHRLKGMTVRVPPLAERREDIPMLARALVARAAKHEGVASLPFADSALEYLVHHPWPGNVRELEQAVTRGLVWAHHRGAPAISLQHLSEDPPPRAAFVERLADAQNAFRVEHCRLVIDRCGGNKKEAAQRLGIARATLYEILGAARVLPAGHESGSSDTDG